MDLRENSASGNFTVHARETLFATASIRADLHINSTSSDALIYTFTPRSNRNLAGFGFGTKFLLGRGFDVVAIKTREDAWYADLTPELLMRLVDAAGGRNYSLRGGYGSSMGGYAAMKFARPLRLARVLAISPLFDIKAEWDKRWERDAKAVKADPMFSSSDLDQNIDYFVVADPKTRDKLHIDKFRNLVRPEHFHYLRAPYGGHPVGHFLNQIGALSHIVLSVFRRGCYPDEMRQFTRRKRHSAMYLFWLAQACLRRGRLAAAHSVNLMAIGINPQQSVYHFQRSKILYAAGSREACIAACDDAIALSPNNPLYLAFREKLN